MSISEDVARLMGKPGKAGMLSKGELERAIVAQYQSIASLLMELYCADPKHKIFAGYTEVQLAPYATERKKRLGSILKRVLRVVRFGK